MPVNNKKTPAQPGKCAGGLSKEEHARIELAKAMVTGQYSLSDGHLNDVNRRARILADKLLEE